MNIILTQFIILTLLAFSSNSCRQIKADSPTERHDISDSGPQKPTPPAGIDSQPIPPLAESWRISLKTSGGYAGGGTGDFVADSTGKLVFQKPPLKGELPPSCQTNLSQPETENLKALAGRWRMPGQSGQDKLKNAANDAFHFKMEISSGSEKYELEFYENTFNDLPQPNQDLVKLLFDSGEKACGKK